MSNLLPGFATAIGAAPGLHTSLRVTSFDGFSVSVLSSEILELDASTWSLLDCGVLCVTLPAVFEFELTSAGALTASFMDGDTGSVVTQSHTFNGFGDTQGSAVITHELFAGVMVPEPSTALLLALAG